MMTAHVHFPKHTSYVLIVFSLQSVFCARSGAWKDGGDGGDTVVAAEPADAAQADDANNKCSINCLKYVNNCKYKEIVTFMLCSMTIFKISLIELYDVPIIIFLIVSVFC